MPIISRAALARSCLLLLATVELGCSEGRPAMQVAGGDAERGKAAIQRYGCGACHTIPGIPGHGANVGPPLSQLRARVYLGGVLPNTPQNLVRWLRNPPLVAPRTAMPNLGVSEAEAADIGAYLYSTD